ncbi:hypothetical protein [Lactobacillus bombicola]|uniref:MacB-like periplasmic core domain-containing protein n=1 Tax=Lactobacillus bombicola TaxID=1505723 RepID=A0A396SRL8_9LACO|nr:hypothetical protein [Lactobacillus bombicola]RHW54648.1 hypothetical protein DS835_03330 [Lactobacillus bombicola]
MKFKKIIIFVTIFLSLLGIGSMLSNIQSREADQLLEAYGLSNNTRYIEVKNNQTISSFLTYLQKNYAKYKIQLHFKSKIDPKQTLIWANHNVITLPTESGRYFTADDFQGRVSFAVLSLNAKVQTLATQGNEYVVLDNSYYSVIGTLKHYHQMKQNGYYLSTGPKQPTGKAKLTNYIIIIDSSSKMINKLASRYKVKIKTPVFVKNHQIHKFSIIREISLVIVFTIIAMSCSTLLALFDWSVVKNTALTGQLLHNWLFNRGVRTILLESALVLGAYLFLSWHAFISKPQQMILLLLLSWFLIIAAYSYTVLQHLRKGKKHA